MNKNENKCYKIIAPLNKDLRGYVVKPMYDDHPEVASFKKYLREPTIGDYIEIRGTSVNVHYFDGTQISSSEEYDDYRGYDGFENLSTEEAISEYLSENQDQLLEVSIKDMNTELAIRYDIQEKSAEFFKNSFYLNECKSNYPEDENDINKYNQKVLDLKKKLSGLSEKLNNFTQNLTRAKYADITKKTSLSERISSAEAKKDREAPDNAIRDSRDIESER